jgi:hypothetical protein
MEEDHDELDDFRPSKRRSQTDSNVAMCLLINLTTLLSVPLAMERRGRLLACINTIMKSLSSNIDPGSPIFIYFFEL